jgi:outer membrane lipoprotein-sorting protein
MTLKEVTLHGTKDAKTIKKLSEFEKMTLLYVDGRKVIIQFIELKENVNFSPKHFEFTPPPKTKEIKG